MNEKAPEAGQGFEGKDQNPSRGTIVNILPDTTDVHQSIEQWARDYEAILRPFLDIAADDPSWVDFLERWPVGYAPDDLMRVTFAQHNTVPPVWPAAATPRWVVSNTVDVISGGEVTVTLDSNGFGGPELHAIVSATVAVVILADADGHLEEGEARPKIGDHTFGPGLQIGWAGPEAWDDSSTDEQIEALGNALVAVAQHRRQIMADELWAASA